MNSIVEAAMNRQWSSKTTMETETLDRDKIDHLMDRPRFPAARLGLCLKVSARLDVVRMKICAI